MSSATSLLRLDDELDAQFSARIDSAVATVRAWESADRSLKEKCRASLPFDKFRQPQLTKDELKDIGDQINTQQTSTSSLLLLHRLTKWFQTSMTWVNQPPCRVCGSLDAMQHAPTRGPETPEEIEGGASRVEVYTCTHCPSSPTTPFPRYNRVATLFRTRRGRCGEYANLFGFTCRSVGFEVRYILDVTDHVWIECWIPELQQWCMADGCEGLIQRFSMYEAGWGKSLSYIIAAAVDHVVDVTPRYTRTWHDAEFQSRRRSITSSEAAGQAVIQHWNDKLVVSSQKQGSSELSLRLQVERQELLHHQQTTEWTEQERNGQGGRISGSWAWKVARQEVGGTTTATTTTNHNDTEKKENNTNSTSTNDTKGYRSFQTESFYPLPSRTTDVANGEQNDPAKKNAMVVTITIPTTHNDTHSALHGLINVSGTNCAVPNVTTLATATDSFISVVVVDQEHPGCILQSRAFGAWEQVAHFVNQVPSHRIIAMAGALLQPSSPPQEEAEGTDEHKKDNLVGVPPSSESASMIQTRLGGFQPALVTPGILYIGQVDAHPSWSVCQSWPEPALDATSNKLVQVVITIPYQPPADGLVLRMERHTQPKCVATRLPDTFMPLTTQLQATAKDKHEAFLAFLQRQKEEQDTTKRNAYVGYTTKPQTPVYLIDSSAYPFWKDQIQAKQPKNGGDGWNTFHLLPLPLVPDQQDIFPNDVAADASTGGASSPQFQVPMEESFFLSLLGPTLLASSRGGQPQEPSLPTLEALSNCRLIGLYFSAHWCGPCRSFTPMLAELFVHLQQETNHAQHGLQIVFVSSDRDELSFQQYFGTMPWLALPFEPWRKQEISQRYGISGIPSLVILDAVSGQIVVNADQSRGEIIQACRGGEESINRMWKNWLTRVPPDTSEILTMLELSCLEDSQPSATAAESANDNAEEQQDNLYLIRREIKPDSATTLDPADRVKQLFAEFVQSGLQANAAAAKAIQQVAEEQKAQNEIKASPKVLDAGPLDQLGKRLDVVALTRTELLQQAVDIIVESNESGKEAVRTVLTTVLKYVENVRKEPWTPKFRSFKLSNKVADRICNVCGGLDLLRTLGLEVFGTSQDFMASVPLSADLETLHADMDGLLKAL